MYPLLTQREVTLWLPLTKKVDLCQQKASITTIQLLSFIYLFICTSVSKESLQTLA